MQRHHRIQTGLYSRKKSSVQRLPGEGASQGLSPRREAAATLVLRPLLGVAATIALAVDASGLKETPLFPIGRPGMDAGAPRWLAFWSRVCRR